MKKQAEVKAVILDWGGVLIEDPAEGFAAWCGKSLGVPPEIMAEAIAPHMPAWQGGELDEESFWQLVCNPLSVGLPNLSKTSLWFDALKGVYKPCEEVFSSIWFLKKARVKIGFCSNTEPPSRLLHLSFGYKFFDARVFSCEEKLLKPDAAIYRLICSRLGLPPESCLMVDDREENVEGAVAAGMQAHLFESGEGYLTDLENRTGLSFPR